MTAQINKIAQRYGIQLVNDDGYYTTTQIYTGEIPAFTLALAISRDVYKELNELVSICIIVWGNHGTKRVDAKYNPAKMHPHGVKGEQRN